jgi:hypothetical protein
VLDMQHREYELVCWGSNNIKKYLQEHNKEINTFEVMKLLGCDLYHNIFFRNITQIDRSWTNKTKQKK